MSGWEFHHRPFWYFASVFIFLAGSSIHSAFAEHAMRGYPASENPDPRVLLIRHLQGDATSLCTGAFVEMPTKKSETRLLTAGHCTSENPADAYKYWTRYINTADKKAEHSKEGEFSSAATKRWIDADVSVVTVAEANLLDATALKLASELPAKRAPVTVLAYAGASHGGFGPFPMRCFMAGTGLFIGTTLDGTTNSHGRISQEIQCPWIVSPGGISGSPVLDGKGDLIGIVTSAVNTGNAFLSAATVIVNGRSRSQLYFTPVLTTNVVAGEFDFKTKDGKVEEKLEDGTELSYSTVNQKLDGRFHMKTELGQTLDVDLKAGLLHGSRTITNADGTVSFSAEYVDGQPVTKIKNE